MLVYGDHRERADPADRLTRLSHVLETIVAMPAGIERHAKLAGALIEAGRVQQGVADESVPDATLSDGGHALARCELSSWDSA